jgi:Na+/H+ antiporter NhaD/arsenite permease-like protein
MVISILAIFILGYLAITFEHALKIDKLIPALLMMACTWGLLLMNSEAITFWLDPNNPQLINVIPNLLGAKSMLIESTLLHHFGKTAEILIFLIGAMAIVEIIDYFDGFSVFQKWIQTKNKVKILWIIAAIGFFLSALIDNLTATIVLITILRKIVTEKETRLYFIGLIIIAANAGGAWSPIGDITTTMLWIAGKVSTMPLITNTFFPALACILVPLSIVSFLPILKGDINANVSKESAPKAALMLFIGLILLLLVPFSKIVFHLPPYMGMMLSLALFSLIAEIVSNRKFTIQLNEAEESNAIPGPTKKALTKIEIPSVLFFLGILMTIAAMESSGMILNFGTSVAQSISDKSFIVLLGLASSVIDNVPLVAASIGMFQFPSDSSLWHLIAYTAGTGGSILLIGSAAGVVAMGMENISFIWYLKHISWIAIIGYFAGIGVFLILH